MTNIVSYNLSDLTATQARAKGDTFYRAWCDFQRALIVRRLVAISNARKEQIA